MPRQPGTLESHPHSAAGTEATGLTALEGRDLASGNPNGLVGSLGLDS